MKTIEERALELYPVKELQLGNYMEDMNGLARISYIRGAEEQRKIDINKVLEYLEVALQCGVHPCNKESFIIGFKKAMEE